MGNKQPPSSRPPTPSPPLLPKPWRRSPPFSEEYLLQLKKNVKQLWGTTKLSTQAKILLLGPVGAGKSSFVNTIDSIFADRKTQIANTGRCKRSLTLTYNEAELEASKEHMTIYLCDTCGIEWTKRNVTIPDLADLNYIIEGNVKDTYQFSDTPIAPGIQHFREQPELKDQIHCVVFVFNVDKVKGTDEHIFNTMIALQRRLHTKNIALIVLLTGIDNILKKGDRKVSEVFSSKYVRDMVYYISDKLGISPGNVMPIINYEEEQFLDTGTSCLAMQAFEKMIGYACDCFRNQINKKKSL